MTMKVKLVNRAQDLGQEKIRVIQEFIKFAQESSPLRRPIIINLLNARMGGMTTGEETPGNIKVLASGRMLNDILRTIGHEWTHEFATQRKIKLSNDNKEFQESLANTEAGIMVRMFEKKYPEFNAILYS